MIRGVLIVVSWLMGVSLLAHIFPEKEPVYMNAADRAQLYPRLVKSPKRLLPIPPCDYQRNKCVNI